MRIAVLCGGLSGERSVSMTSGRAVVDGLSRSFAVDLMEIAELALPSGLRPDRHVVFSTLHGTYGEDGQFQALLDAQGIVYAGCGVASCELTFDKVRTKATLAEAGIPVLPQLLFRCDAPPSFAEVRDGLGFPVVLKPTDQGSSLGIVFAENQEELEAAFASLQYDSWMIEPKVIGKEVSLGVVDGEALEIVEIRPKAGFYDFDNKYTKGRTEYLVPAPLDPSLTEEIKAIAARSFALCSCRDFARIDLMIDHASRPFALEVNALPGMTATSLLPMSAAAAGMNFESLLKKLVEPACSRFRSQYPAL